MELALQKIGKYEIHSELGRGGMAVVYHATDTTKNRQVALKVLPPTLATHENTLNRFEREGQNASQLQHENIVEIYEAGAADGYHYIAMELVHGQPLDEYIIEKGRLFTIDENITLLSEIAAGLDYAHSKGIIHRDIKPANILVSSIGQVMLADFGVARQLFVEQTMYTMAGQSVGTPAYMSPEQARGQDNIDFRSDVYSFGVLAYKLFTGRTPFQSADQLQMMRKVVMEDPIPVHEIDPEIPLNISQVVQKCLAKNPQERYESAGSFMGALTRGHTSFHQVGPFGQGKSANDEAATGSSSGFTWYSRTFGKMRTQLDEPKSDRQGIHRQAVDGQKIDKPKVSSTAMERRTQRNQSVTQTLSGRQLTKNNQKSKWITLGILTCGVAITGIFYGNAWFDRQAAIDQLNKASDQIEERISTSDLDPVGSSKRGIETITEKTLELEETARDAVNQKADTLANAVEEKANGIALPEDEIGEVVNTISYPRHSAERLRTALSQRFKAASEWISKTISGDSTKES